MSEMTRNTLSKKERVCGKKRIDELFASGKSFVSYPLRIVYIKRDKKDGAPMSVMVSVSKKKFKRAVKRNRVKRLIREAYRLRKRDFFLLAEKYDADFDLAFLFLKDELPDYEEIENSMQKTLSVLDSKLTGHADE